MCVFKWQLDGCATLTHHISAKYLYFFRELTHILCSGITIGPEIAPGNAQETKSGSKD